MWKSIPDCLSAFGDSGFVFGWLVICLRDLGAHIWRIVGKMLHGCSCSFGGLEGGCLGEFFQMDVFP